jgi:SAM-dependent methyltransferase
LAEDLSWAPPGVDPGKASIARVYDYWLGGTHNFPVDRDAARALIAVGPWARGFARENRAFLARAVRFLAAAGVRQFLDIGSGIPTQGNVHEIAGAAVPGARVMYADIDPVAVAHSRSILAGDGNAAVIQADLRNPEKILASPGVRGLLDLGEPVGLLLGAVLHFITDEEDPWRIVRSLRDALAPGSYLVVSHATTEDRPSELTAAYEEAYTRSVAARGTFRSRAGIGRFFDGLDLIEPGVVYLPDWRPGTAAPAGNPAQFRALAGVGRKP